MKKYLLISYALSLFGMEELKIPHLTARETLVRYVTESYKGLGLSSLAVGSFASINFMCKKNILHIVFLGTLLKIIEYFQV